MLCIAIYTREPSFVQHFCRAVSVENIFFQKFLKGFGKTFYKKFSRAFVLSKRFVLRNNFFGDAYAVHSGGSDAAGISGAFTAGVNVALADHG